MLTRTPRIATAVGALSILLLLTACGDSQELPEIQTPQAQEQFDGESVVGFMVEANSEKVSLQMPDGSFRTFAVREEDAPQIGIGHLASHIGFEVFYESEGDTDYIVGAQEVAPPR